MMVQWSPREREILSSCWINLNYRVPTGTISVLSRKRLDHGLSLTSYLPEKSWEVAKQLVEAVVYMHSMNIVHGSKYPLKSSCTKGNLRALTGRM